MKPKFVVVGSLLIAALGVWLWGMPQGERAPEPVTEVVLAPAKVPLIQAIEIEAYSKIKKEVVKIRMAKEGAGSWVIKTDNDFPVDASRIATLLDRLSARRLVERVTDKRDDFA